MNSSIALELIALGGVLTAVVFVLIGIRKTVLRINKALVGILLVLLILHPIAEILEEFIESGRMDLLEDLIDLLIVIAWGYLFYGCCEAVTQERLTAETRKTQRALDGLPELIWISDTDKLCTHFNTAWLNFTGRTLSQEIGNGWAEGVHQEDLPGCLQTYTSAFDLRQPFSMEYRLRRFDGEYRWLSDRGVPYYDADAVFAGYIGSCVDITEQREAEQELRMQSQLLYSVKESVIATDLEGRITYWGPGAESLYGYKQPKVIGQPITLIVPPGEENEEMQRMRTVLETGFWHGEYQQTRSNGSRFWAETFISLVTNEDGEPTGLIGIDRDITSRKQAEEILQRQNELVEAELGKAKRQLVAKTRFATIGQISAQIAHEMRNPLGAAKNAVYLLRRKIPSQAPKVGEYLDLIEHEINTCNRFITDLLEKTPPQPPRRELVDLSQAFESAKSHHILPEGVSLSFSADRQPFEIYFDRTQIIQVLDNLIANSLAALEGEGIIDITAQQMHEYAMLTVQDSGKGIPLGNREQIFEWLFTSKTRGSGLGLPICRQIVERHGGTIDLRCDGVTTGAVFEIRIPRHQHEQQSFVDH